MATPSQQKKNPLQEIFDLLDTPQFAANADVLAKVQEDIMKDRSETVKVHLMSAVAAFEKHQKDLVKLDRQTTKQREAIKAAMTAIRTVMTDVAQGDDEALTEFAERMSAANGKAVVIGTSTGSTSGHTISATSVGIVGSYDSARPCRRAQSCVHLARA